MRIIIVYRHPGRFMQGKVFYIVALAVSMLLHGLLGLWWWQRPVTEPVALGVAPAVTVSLLAAPAPSPAVAPAPPVPTPPPPPVAQKPEVAQKAEVAKLPKVEKKPPPKPVRQPVAQTAPPTPQPAAPAPVVPAARTDSAPAPAAAPAQSAARYDADYLDNPAPAYPALSRRLGEEGKVVLEVEVSPDGRPRQVKVKASSGVPRLDKAALQAVERWRFVPARQGDQAVSSWVDVPIQFSLKQ